MEEELADKILKRFIKTNGGSCFSKELAEEFNCTDLEIKESLNTIKFYRPDLLRIVKYQGYVVLYKVHVYSSLVPDIVGFLNQGGVTECERLRIAGEKKEAHIKGMEYDNLKHEHFLKKHSRWLWPLSILITLIVSPIVVEEWKAQRQKEDSKPQKATNSRRAAGKGDSSHIKGSR